MTHKLLTLVGILALTSCCVINPSMCDIDCGHGRKVPRPKDPKDAYKLAYNEYEIGIGEVQSSLASILKGNFSPTLKTKVVKLKDDIGDEVIKNKHNAITELLKVQVDPCNAKEVIANLEANKTLRLYYVEKYKLYAQEIAALKGVEALSSDNESEVAKKVEGLKKVVEESKKKGLVQAN